MCLTEKHGKFNGHICEFSTVSAGKVCKDRPYDIVVSSQLCRRQVVVHAIAYTPLVSARSFVWQQLYHCKFVSETISTWWHDDITSAEVQVLWMLCKYSNVDYLIFICTRTILSTLLLTFGDPLWTRNAGSCILAYTDHQSKEISNL